MRVTSGPNLRGPIFNQFLYEVTVSESSSKFAKVVTVEAKDPESDPVRYSIVAGNEEDIFQVRHSGTNYVRQILPLNALLTKKSTSNCIAGVQSPLYLLYLIIV